MAANQRSRALMSVSTLDSFDDLPDLKPLPQSHAPLACEDPSKAVPFDMSILTISHRKDVNTIKALIVGGGIAGLSLAIMMDMAGMEYEILERCTGDEPEFGAALTLGPPVLRLLEQMGLLEQVEQASSPVTGITVVDSEGRKMGRLESFTKERYGYPFTSMTRPALHKILLDRVPKGNLHRGKTVVETLQNPNGVTCKCSDGSTYYGDIIVGADGAQSLTRERLYAQLIEQGKLPEADMEPSVYEHVSAIGVSDKLDEKHYPSLSDKESEFRVVYTKEKEKSCSFWYLPVPGNRVAWGLNAQLPTPKYKFQCQSPSATASTAALTRPQVSSVSSSSSSSSLSQQKIYDDWMTSAPDLEDEFRYVLDARCAVGTGTVRDFLSHTPREKIARVDLVERLYKTWYHGRIVLLGDACHPHLVVGGQGSIQCLLDAVCLVNLLYDMEYNSPHEITKAFKKYHTKRSVIAKTSIDDTSAMDKVFHSQGLLASMMRKLLFNSTWSFSIANDKFNNNRPQLSFLPFVEDRATSKANKQKVSERLTRNLQAYPPL
ncbi:hypothetical protein BC939DRAFT_529766 [Gamsiella multidivaricata]|uniref:uncharacterized protein n=1 Tax=Gamsiella multidivaricata TaxID=101098 RepID=UPI00221FED00|nr:uncharacterized protein BC939DRAFT_529766 [Gamsiella multidivaricata]KAG0359305.1 hypothetical protein BGZ54_010015 [Gamsiella multidivaricata]KAI7822056.1 hypothetical protein BC939DRAFT_529766 [Gamsiella multidivaricata]